MNESASSPRPEQLRSEYQGAAFDETALADDPLVQFQRWFDEAVRREVDEPNAMVLSTIDCRGRPRQRTVLLKGVDERGFVFFTNYNSAKATDIADCDRVNLLFGWYGMHRQVIVAGRASAVSRGETDRYFASRPRGAQLAAWASAQSSRLDSRQELEESYAACARRFNTDVPTPPNWGGFLVEPDEIEFWQGRRDRLHDRLRFIRADDGGWAVVRLAP